METQLDFFGIAWRAAATIFFVFLNGFFVAAEFALVKVRHARIRTLADEGSRSARVATHILGRLDHYLSACQLGITIASLALGALGEPAVARLLRGAIKLAGWRVDPHDALLHTASFLLAFAAITVLHITLGEQAPKIWALQRSEPTALRVAFPLRWFSAVFSPFIAFVNGVSNGMLRLVGVSSDLEEATHTSEELRSLISASAKAGHITARQQEFAENVLWMVNLEVRHILVPRVEVAYVCLEHSLEKNLEVLERTGHSRFPVCEVGLDTVVGILHTKDLIPKLRGDGPIDLRALARPPIFASETQPLSRLMIELQNQRQQCAIVVDERGSCTGMVFLEDALEEIVGPIQDEFDAELPDFVKVGPEIYELAGRMALPEAMDRLGLDLEDADEDTIGGYVVARLRRLPRLNDSVEIGPYEVTVARLAHRSIERLRFERKRRPDSETAAQ